MRVDVVAVLSSETTDEWDGGLARFTEGDPWMNGGGVEGAVGVKGDSDEHFNGGKHRKQNLRRY
jgi:hypothetical protein